MHWCCWVLSTTPDAVLGAGTVSLTVSVNAALPACSPAFSSSLSLSSFSSSPGSWRKSRKT